MNIIFFISGLPWLLLVTVIVLKSTYFNIITLFIITWFGESFVGYGLVPDGMPDILMIYVIFLMCTKILIKEHQTINYYNTLPGMYIFLFFLAISIVSAIINQTHIINYLLFNRSFLFPFLFFMALFYTSLTANDIQKINKFIIYLFLLQVIVSTFKWVITPMTVGEFSQESIASGTFESSGGTFATLIPLITFGYIITSYFITKKKKYLFALLAFIWFGILGSKRALVFIIPVFIVIILYYIKSKMKLSLDKTIPVLIIVLLLIISIVFINHTLNPEQKIGGSIDIKYIYNYARYYTTVGSIIDNQYFTQGRVASTVKMINNLFSAQTKHILFGYGPGTAIDSQFTQSTHREFFLMQGIEDGITGAIWMMAQVGLLGVVSFFMFLIVILRHLTKILSESTNQYQITLLITTIITLFVFLFDFLIYSEIFIRTENLLILFYYLLGISLKRNSIKSYNIAK